MSIARLTRNLQVDRERRGPGGQLVSRPDIDPRLGCRFDVGLAFVHEPMGDTQDLPAAVPVPTWSRNTIRSTEIMNMVILLVCVPRIGPVMPYIRAPIYHNMPVL